MPGVCIAYISRLDTKARFMSAYADLLTHDAANDRHLLHRVNLISGPRIAEARSQVVDAFGQTDADWLLMIDDDMTFEPDMLDRLLAVADERTAPVVGGLCFAGVHGGRIYPTLYRAYNEEGGHLAVEPVSEYPADALVKVGATGAACLLVHKRVFAAMRRPGPKHGESFDPAVHGFGTKPDGTANPFPWFTEGLTTSKGIPLGEDVAFCRRLMLLGIPVHVHTGVKLGHCKEWVITEDDFDAYHREQARPSQGMIDAALTELRRSGRFSGDQIDELRAYLRPRYGIVAKEARPAPEPFLLPEAVPT